MSVERVVSGSGIPNVYEFLSQVNPLDLSVIHVHALKYPINIHDYLSQKYPINTILSIHPHPHPHQPTYHIHTPYRYLSQKYPISTFSLTD